MNYDFGLIKPLEISKKHFKYFKGSINNIKEQIIDIY